MNGVLDFSAERLILQFDELGLEKFRVRQVLDWVYSKGATTFYQMTNLNKQTQDLLSNNYYIYRPQIADIKKSIDGTIKFLLRLDDMLTVETVFIPDRRQISSDHLLKPSYLASNSRNTICVSSQVGCAVGCKFCNTGYNGFKRNLRAEEIIGQVLIIKDYVNSWQKQSNRISNIVFMGMGEPLYNWNNVNTALQNLKQGNGQGLSPKRITLSTSGVVPVLEKIIPTLECNLAISLHAPNSLIRSSIMPINDLYHLEKLLSVCKKYNRLYPNKLITFEYLLLEGINDSYATARQLVKLLHGIKCKVNLIQFNTWGKNQYKGSSADVIDNFQRILKSSGINVTLRKSKGTDIMAACGQLKSSN